MAADGRIDRAMRAGRDTPYQREIAALELARSAMVGELVGKRAMRLIGLGHDKQSARIFVEAMHDPGARDPANA